MSKVKIGNRTIGNGKPCFIIAEIGINHNGDIPLVKKLVDAAVFSGCDAVKFQKRTVEVVYTPEELAKPRENPFGKTNGDLKRGLEFSREAYDEIDAYCREKGLMWFASCWDAGAVDFIDAYNPPCYTIATASLTDDNLLRHHREKNRPIILSTGMSTLAQIDHAIEVLGHEDLVLLHCTSTYPSAPKELNLSLIPKLRDLYPDIPVGYSGHEAGLSTSLAATALGACVVERHITLDRSMWGSDQAASVEPYGMYRLIKDIRAVAVAMGDGEKRVYDSEVPIIEKLRRV